MDKIYRIVCPRCGFEYSDMCDEKVFEENKEPMLACPCGGTMEVVEVKEVPSRWTEKSKK